MNNIPRRARLDLNEPAELAIWNAVQEVENLGADVRLTNAVNLLSQAKELVSNFIDSKPVKREFTQVDTSSSAYMDKN